MTKINPQRRRFLRHGVIIGGGVLGGSLLGACQGHGQDPQIALQQLLSQRWNARYATQPGGLCLSLITPQGQYFASTLNEVTASDTFRAASTTKTFTAAAIMLLDQNGLLHIDDVITANMPGQNAPYVPETPAFAIPYKNQITIRQLLSHWAGMFDVTNQEVPSSSSMPYAGQIYKNWVEQQQPTHSFTKTELIEVLAVNQLSNAAPGVSFHYSDSHYQLLGVIIERVSGQALNNFLLQAFLQPLGLSQSHFVIDGSDQMLPAPFLAGYTLDGGNVNQATQYNYSYDPGSGNLVASIADLTRWIRQLIRAEAGVNAAQVARMCAVVPSSHYGLGIMQLAHASTEIGFGHNGGTDGYLTYAGHDLVTDVSFVIQSSLADFSQGIDSFSAQGSWMTGIVLDARQLLGYFS